MQPPFLYPAIIQFFFCLVLQLKAIFYIEDQKKKTILWKLRTVKCIQKALAATLAVAKRDF